MWLLPETRANYVKGLYSVLIYEKFPVINFKKLLRFDDLLQCYRRNNFDIEDF